MTGKLFRAHAAHGGANCILQLLQITIQALIPRGTCVKIREAS
jgi:hypothetical protein